MAQKIFIIPAKGAKLRDPENGMAVVPPDGGLVKDTPYMRRRIADGDATVRKEQAQKPEKRKRPEPPQTTEPV